MKPEKQAIDNENEKRERRKEFVSLVIMSVMLLGVPLLDLLIADDLSGMRLSYLLTMLALYLLPACVLKRRAYYWALYIFLPLNLSEMVHLVMYKHTATMMWTYTILISEGGELLEGLSVYWPIVLMLLALYVWYAYANKHYVRREYWMPKRWRRIGGVVSGGWIVLACLMSCLGVRWFESFERVTPMNTCIHLGRIVNYHHHIGEGLRQANTYRFGSTTDAPEDELVILVLGESSRYYNWELNGYERETNPLLMQRADHICTFDSVYTVGNLTTVSVPMILSRATPNTLNRYVEEASVVDAIREAGYKTAWVADQSFGNKFMLNISGRCDYIYYIEHENFKFHDEELLVPMGEWMREGGRQMAVFHALGCHAMYNARYPMEYSHFRPDLNDVRWEEVRGLLDVNLHSVDEGDRFSAAANVVKTILTNSYDNAIRYTDMVLDSLIAMAESTGRPAVVLYVGDHGENLLDNDRHRIMHGQVSDSEYEFHVPLWAWTSDTWRALYPEKAEAMVANKHKHISTMNVYHSLLDMAEVDCGAKDETMSIVSTKLVADTAIWILDSDLRSKRLEPVK